MTQAQQTFFSKIEEIVQKDSRYHPEAYPMVLAGLNRALKKIKKPRHLTGAELLEGLRLEAADLFGPMARTVFEFWGIKNSLDFGHIVFNMVHVGLLAKTENDKLEDFKDTRFLSRLFDESEGYSLESLAESAPKKRLIKSKKQPI